MKPDRLLNVESINPKLHPRYSLNLYIWMARGRGKNINHVIGIFRDAEGVLWIGHKDENCPRELFGARLFGVLCNGGREQSAAWQGFDGVEISDFWSRYVAAGRCAIDTEHARFFIGDESRWVTDGDSRSCQWCGKVHQTMRRWTETVEKSDWVTT